MMKQLTDIERAAKIASLRSQYKALDRKWDLKDGQGQPTESIATEMERVADLIKDLEEKRDEEQENVAFLREGFRQFSSSH